jgi:hypothetical protein
MSKWREIVSSSLVGPGLKSHLYLKFITTFSHLLQFLSYYLTILVWYSCCIVACYRGVVRAYSPFHISYTIRLYPVNLLQHWGLIAAHLSGGYNCPTVLIRSAIENSFMLYCRPTENRLCLLCLYPLSMFYAILKL